MKEPELPSQVVYELLANIDYTKESLPEVMAKFEAIRGKRSQALSGYAG